VPASLREGNAAFCSMRSKSSVASGSKEPKTSTTTGTNLLPAAVECSLYFFSFDELLSGGADLVSSQYRKGSSRLKIPKLRACWMIMRVMAFRFMVGRLKACHGSSVIEDLHIRHSAGRGWTGGSPSRLQCKFGIRGLFGSGEEGREHPSV
jgi:hypothetical protein